MSAFKRVFAFLRPYRGQMLLALAATVTFTGLNLLPPLLMRYFIDNVVRPGAWELLAVVAVAIAMIPILSGIVRFGNVWIIMYVGQRVIADLRVAMYRKILALGMPYHSTHSSGAICARLMDDVNRLKHVLTAETVRMVVDIIVFICSIGFVFYVKPPLGWILLGFVALYVVVYRVFSRRIHRSTRAFRNLYDAIAGRLNETIAGVRHVRIYNREERETELFLHRTSRSLNRQVASRMGSVNLGVAFMGISGFGSTIVMALSGWFVIHDGMTLGSLLAVNAYLWMALSPAVHLTQMLGQLSETFVSVDRIAETLGTGSRVRSERNAPPMPRGRGAVEFRDVTFSYLPDQPVYRNLSLKVDAGMTVALVGPTGCGKTTFTSLLMRDWDVQGGHILIDGIDIRTVRLRSLRGLFGVVLQDPVIFEGTLVENIAYGWPDAPREKIEATARAAEIYPDDFDNGLDTLIGTGGVKLSVGERQRVAIARAILADPLILIMDEATSSLDSPSEALIQRALDRVLVGRTSFIVAHRLSTITAADMIVVMDAGQIVETGRHEKLLEIAGGMYRGLYEEMLGRQGGGES